MKKLPLDPRIPDERSFFRQTLDWMREAARAVNSVVDELAGFTVTRSGASGTEATIAPINGATGDAVLTLNKGGSGTNAAINARRNGVIRWQLLLGNSSAEGGGNSGSDANLVFFNDAGAGIGSIDFRRSDGRIGTPGDIVSTRSMQAGSAHGFQANGAFADGANFATQVLLFNPSWDSVSYQGYHVPGSWAGCRWILGSTSPAVFEMRNNGTGYSVGGWVATSDARVKVNRQPLGDVLSWIDEIETCEYDRIDVANLDGSPVHRAGFIANSFEPHAPALVLQDKPTDEEPDPIRSLDYDGAGAYLWRAVVQLKALVLEQQAQIDQLKGAANGN